MADRPRTGRRGDRAGLHLRRHGRSGGAAGRRARRLADVDPVTFGIGRRASGASCRPHAGDHPRAPLRPALRHGGDPAHRRHARPARHRGQRAVARLEVIFSDGTRRFARHDPGTSADVVLPHQGARMLRRRRRPVHRRRPAGRADPMPGLARPKHQIPPRNGGGSTRVSTPCKPRCCGPSCPGWTSTSPAAAPPPAALHAPSGACRGRGGARKEAPGRTHVWGQYTLKIARTENATASAAGSKPREFRP